MRIVYIVTGYGRAGECFGEFAQAEASALHAKENGDEVIFIIKNKRLIDIVRKYGIQTFHSDDTPTTQQLIAKIAPDVIFLCNSKTVYMYKHSIMREPPLDPKPFICSLDSNWLFLEERRIGFPVPPWIDRIYVVFTNEIYQMGIMDNGGHYKISDSFKEKIFCPGFIPSSRKITETERESRRKELNVKNDEKLIAVYFGLTEEYIIPKFLPKFSQIIEELIQGGCKIKVWFKGKAIIERDWITCTSWVKTTQLFDLTMASADLVIQHHGMGNLTKVIRNAVPIICFVSEVKRDRPYYWHLEYYEVEPFARLNLCCSLPYNVSGENLKESIVDLLYDEKKITKMKKAQETYFHPGEENQYNDLVKCLESSNKNND